jgi:hypothetical protein
MLVDHRADAGHEEIKDRKCSNREINECPTKRYRQPRLRAADSGRFQFPIVRGEVSELHRWANRNMAKLKRDAPPCVSARELPFPLMIFDPRGRGMPDIYCSPQDMEERADLLSVWPEQRYRLIADDFREFQVIRPQILGGAGRMWGIRIGMPFGFFRRMRFDLLVTLRKILSVEDFIALLCRDMEYAKGTVDAFRSRLLEEARVGQQSAGELFRISVRLGEQLYDELAKARSGKRPKAAQPGATDNPDDAQRLREDH